MTTTATASTETTPIATNPVATTTDVRLRALQAIPILVRGDDELQLGLGERAIVVHGERRGIERIFAIALHSKDFGGFERTVSRSRLNPALLDWLLARLAEADLLRSSKDPDRRQRVKVIGCGEVGAAIAELLWRASPTTDLYLYDGRTTVGALGPNGAVRGRADRLARRLIAQRPRRLHARAGAGQVRALSHWSAPESLDMALTILVSETAEVDRTPTGALVRDDVPHLVVQPRQGAAEVGPLVVPGRTACLRCIDLTRRDGDPVWPSLLRQLNRLELAPSPAVASWAATQAAVQALAYLSGGEAETLSAVLELDATDLLTRRRVWPMHPWCGCGWSEQARMGA